ncbi:DNA recombination protein RmuC [Microbulbifer marinus]|nr:DNA recombination protein RmuC [Microbulbifer marinus]
MEYWLLAGSIAAIAALLAYLIASSRAGKALALVQGELAKAEVGVQELLLQRDSAQQQLESANKELGELRLEERALRTGLQAVEKSEAELKQRYQKLEQTLEAQRIDLRKAENSLHATSKELEQSRQQLGERSQDLQQRLEEARASYRALEQKHEQLQAQHSALNAEHAQLQTSLAERDESHRKQLAHFEEQKKALGEEFKVLASEILDQKSKALQENSNTSLNALMNPFKQSIDSFKKEVQDIHHRETSQRSELRKELEQLKELNHQITTEAHELSTALRGQKKLQGNWGEMMLENVLDRSGLQQGKDYVREKSFTTEEGKQRPDVIVNLPQGKHLIVDAKVSLNAYTRYVNSEDEAERALALEEHVKAVGERIKELADRDYYKINELNSPEMVFLFIPIESAFVEALKANESLFQTAIESNVLVATPTTLLTSLNIVRQLWRFEDQNKHTAALANKAESVFKKLNGFLGSFESIKKSLDKASEAYTKAEGQLISGRGNLVKQVGEFKNLAPAIKAELPGYFTDKAELEIDYIPQQEQLAEPQDKPQAGTEEPAAEYEIEEVEN